MQSYTDQLTSALKNRILDKLTECDQLCNKVINVLSASPNSIEELVEIQVKAVGMKSEALEWDKQWSEISNYQNVLKSVVGVTLSLEEQRSRTNWDKMKATLEGMESKIKEKVEILKADCTTKAQLLNNEFERVLAKWKETSNVLSKVSDVSLHSLEQMANSIKEYETMLVDLDAQTSKLHAQAKSIELSLEFSSLPDLKIAVEQAKELFKTCQSFLDDLNQMRNRSWRTMRAQLNEFEDFLKRWSSLLVGIDTTSNRYNGLLVMIIHKFESLIEVLPYVRGDTFDDSHWEILVSYLGWSLRTIIVKRESELSDRQTRLSAIKDAAAQAEERTRITVEQELLRRFVSINDLPDALKFGDFLEIADGMTLHKIQLKVCTMIDVVLW